MAHYLLIIQRIFQKPFLCFMKLINMYRQSPQKTAASLCSTTLEELQCFRTSARAPCWPQTQIYQEKLKKYQNKINIIIIKLTLNRALITRIMSTLTAATYGHCEDQRLLMNISVCMNRFVVSCIPTWFWGPMVTLEDCLAAFFAADELKGRQSAVPLRS